MTAGAVAVRAFADLIDMAVFTSGGRVYFAELHAGLVVVEIRGPFFVTVVAVAVKFRQFSGGMAFVAIEFFVVGL